MIGFEGWNGPVMIMLRTSAISSGLLRFGPARVLVRVQGSISFRRTSRSGVGR